MVRFTAENEICWLTDTSVKKEEQKNQNKQKNQIP